MARHLVLFARAPGREAAEKGFARRDAEAFFAELAKDWWRAAESAGARLVVASPPEDRLAWRRCLGDDRSHIWIRQRGASFGERLESSGRAAAELCGDAVIVGGDVVASAQALEDAFAALEAGADAVLGPAPDGGVSLVAMRSADLDLLATIEPRRADVFRRLRARLLSRRRRLIVVRTAGDVDGRRGLRGLLSAGRCSETMRASVRRALTRPEPIFHEIALFPGTGNHFPLLVRGPPACG